MTNDLKAVFDNMTFDATDNGSSYNSNVLLLDGMNFFIRSYCAVPTMDDNGTHIGAITGFIKSLGSMIRMFKPTRCIVVFDGKGGSQRRRKIYPGYKQNRKPAVRLNRTYDLTTDEQESENMRWQLMYVVEILRQLPVTVMSLDNVEADDVIAYLTQLIADRGGKSMICSSDKDFLQLVSPTVKVYSPIKKKTYNEDTVLREYGIHPKHFYFFRALDGDKSDNINGVKGVGLASLRKMIPEVADPTYDINMQFVKNKFVGVKKIPKMIQNIINEEVIVERNIVLMNLHDGIMSTSARLTVVNKFDNDELTFDKYELTKQLIAGKLISAFPTYNEWLIQTFVPLMRFS